MNPVSATLPRNLLPLIFVITAIMAVIAWRFPIGPSLGAAYMCVVLLSLRSSRTSHTYITAALGTLLLALQIGLAASRGFKLPLATSMVNAALMLVSIWAVAVMGVRTMHIARRESAALAEAMAMSRQSLVRQQILDRLVIAAEAANLWVWEVTAGRKLTWDMNPLKILGLDQVPSEDRWQAFDERLEPEELERMSRQMRKHFASYQPRMSHRFRALGIDGTRVHLQTNAYVTYGSDGKIERVIGVTADISMEVEHAAQMEEQLAHAQQLQERIDIAAHAAGLWIWERNPHTREFVWDTNSPAELGLNNVPYDEYQRRLRQSAPPEDVVSSSGVIGEALARSQRHYNLTYRTCNPDGSICYRASNAEIVYGEDGQAKRIIGVTRDVTQDVQTNNMIQQQAEQERLLRVRLATAAQAVGIHCWQLNFTPQPQMVWSENIAMELGEDAEQIPLEERIERLCASVHPDDLPELIGKDSLRARMGEKNHVIQFRRTMPDGRVRYMQSYHHYFVDADGKLVQIIGATVEITKHVAAQIKLKEQAEELADAKRRMERASASSQEGHWELDLVNDVNWISDNYRTLLGYSKDLDIGTLQRYRALVHPDDWDEQDAKVNSAHDRYEHSVRMRHADGSWRWMQARGAVERDDKGALVRLTGSIRDITEQKIAQKSEARS